MAKASMALKEQLSNIERAEHVAALGGVKKVAAQLGCDLRKGLDNSRVEPNRAQFGENRVPSKPPRSYWDHLKDTFEDETIRILIFSAFCSIVFGFFVTNDEGREEDVIQGFAILLSVAVVSSVQSFQNWSKDREFQSLAALRADRAISVIRNGAEISISVYEVVVGDLIKLTSGDAIPCDGLLLSGFDCEVDQSNMTGESELVRKSETGDALLLGSTTLREGEGQMLVTAVGVTSRMGKTIQALEDSEPEETPLQQKLGELAGQIGRIGTAAGAMTFAVLSVLWYLREDPNKRLLDILSYFIIGVAIVVVAVPEGLPLAVTISLAFSMRRMMADNNLVRTLAACETMGSATVIASDKTGTLTENRMSVTEGWVYGTYCQQIEQLAGVMGNPGAAARLARAIACNSTAELVFDSAGRVQFVRSPSECALLLMLLRSLNISYDTVRDAEPLARRPFRKDNKYMSTIVAGDPGEPPILFITGAPEVVLGMCGTSMNRDADEIALTGERLYNTKEQIKAMASKGLRTLAVAFKRLPQGSKMNKAQLQEALMAGTFETGAALIGLFGLQDPLREGVTEAVHKCRQAGIRVVMVTGDHPDTARHIATQCGIYLPGSMVLEGETFRNMSEGQRNEAARKMSVMARCSPTDKLLLVETLKAQNEIVAVTGDGTNDAPALRAADVGLAMGIAGTEVAKEASDIVIMDDRFSSIVASVRWGRSIKENIRKFLSFQLTINIVALTLTFISACTSGGRSELPLKPVQLLWVNLIMDSFAALALATEPPSDKLMEQMPQGKDESLITRTMFKNMVGHALYQTALLLWMTQVPTSTAFFFLKEDQMGASLHDTIVFNTFVCLQVFNLFNARTVHDEWNILKDFSKSLVGQVILIVIVFMQWMIVQFGGDIMQTEPLSLHQWAVCIAVGFSSVPVGFILKLVPACEAELMKIAPGTVEEEAGAQTPEATRLHNQALSFEGAAFTADAAVKIKAMAARSRENLRARRKQQEE